MRGRYYDDRQAGFAALAGHVTRNDDDVDSRPASILEGPTAEQNARDNASKAAAGEGPQVIAGPDTPFNREDLSAIVRHVALRVLLSEVDYSESDLRGYYPELSDITSEQLREAIREGLE